MTKEPPRCAAAAVKLQGRHALSTSEPWSNPWSNPWSYPWGSLPSRRVNISITAQPLTLHARLSTRRAPRKLLIALCIPSASLRLPRSLPLNLPSVSYDDNEHTQSSSVAAASLMLSFLQLAPHFWDVVPGSRVVGSWPLEIPTGT
jgi:hypothetical protein